MKIIVNSLDYRGSIVDGPGIRTVLFVQGCEQRCEGCHNPNTWDKDRGKSVPVSNLAKEIRAKSFNKKLTISGGEPLLQVPSIIELIQQLNDFSIALYTGFELKDVPKEILEQLDYIKVGTFDIKKKSTTIDYIGSTNQCFIDLRRMRWKELKSFKMTMLHSE